MSFYATYSASESSGSAVTASQGTIPWIVAGQGTAGSAAAGVVTVQGITSGTPIPISGSITATNPSVAATGAAVPASGTYIAASVAGTLTGLVATANGLKVDVAASVLPTGAATESTLAAQSAKLPATLGQKTSANSMAVVVASDQSAIPVSGSVTVSGTVAATQSGTWNITNVSGTVSLPTGAATETTLAAINTKTPALGQAAMAASSPVVIASDQSAIPTTVASLPLPSGAATEATLAKLTLTQASTTSGQTGALVQGAVTSVPPSYSNAQTSPLNLNIFGGLRTEAAIVAPVTTSTAIWQAETSVAGGSITGSYVTLFTPTASTKILMMRNNTNAAVAVSLDAGSTTNFVLDSGDQVLVDLLCNALSMGATAIQVKTSGSAPTTGNFRINACH